MHRTIDMKQYLSHVPFFSDLSETERTRLALGCQLKRLARGDMVFRTGDTCDAFYVVILGQVKLYVTSPTGQEKVIEIVGPGRSFAEAMMFLEIPCILNVQSLTDTLLLCVSKDAVFKEIESDPRFALRMLGGISRRLHGLVKDVEGYALRTGMQRLIGYLLHEAGDSTDTNASLVKVSLPVSKATIASRLSLTPEHFSRVLRELEVNGLIAVDKRDVHILDLQRLANYDAN